MDRSGQGNRFFGLVLVRRINQGIGDVSTLVMIWGMSFWYRIM